MSELDQVEFKNLKASLAGSGDLHLRGRSDEADYSIAGSGDIRAADFVARRTKVNIAGSGDAQVHATESLQTSIAGSGDVVYHGKPASVKSNVVGSGEVKPAR